MLRRNRKRSLGVLALLAVALQMVLSFAHTHVSAGHLAGFDAASTSWLDKNDAPCAAPAHHPADHDQNEVGCLICLAASQSAATILSAAQEVARPIFKSSVFKPLRSAQVCSATKAANFYARGPPAA